MPSQGQNFDASDYGWVSILRDNPDTAAGTNTKVGGASCVWGFATSTGNIGGVVIIDTSADFSYTTTASANATTVAGFVVAKMGPGLQWDFAATTWASGDKILICKSGRVKAIASTSISRGARVGTSTTAGQVVTTTTQDASAGRAVTAATTQGDTIYVDVNS